MVCWKTDTMAFLYFSTSRSLSFTIESLTTLSMSSFKSSSFSIFSSLDIRRIHFAVLYFESKFNKFTCFGLQIEASSCPTQRLSGREDLAEHAFD